MHVQEPDLSLGEAIPDTLHAHDLSSLLILCAATLLLIAVPSLIASLLGERDGARRGRRSAYLAGEDEEDEEDEEQLAASPPPLSRLREEHAEEEDMLLMAPPSAFMLQQAARSAAKTKWPPGLPGARPVVQTMQEPLFPISPMPSRAEPPRGGGVFAGSPLSAAGGESEFGSPDGGFHPGSAAGWDPALLQATQRSMAQISSIEGLFASAEFKAHMQAQHRAQNKRKGVQLECAQELERKRVYLGLSAFDPEGFRRMFSRPISDIKSYATTPPSRLLLITDTLFNAAVAAGCCAVAYCLPPTTPLPLRALPAASWLLSLLRAWSRGHPSLLSPLFGVYLVYDVLDSSDEDVDDIGDEGEYERPLYAMRALHASGGRLRRSVKQEVAGLGTQLAAWAVDACLTAGTLGVWAVLSLLQLALAPAWRGRAGLPPRRATLVQRLLNVYPVRERVLPTLVARAGGSAGPSPLPSPYAPSGGQFGAYAYTGSRAAGVHTAGGAGVTPPSVQGRAAASAGLHGAGRGLGTSMAAGYDSQARARGPEPGHGAALTACASRTLRCRRPGGERARGARLRV